MRGWRRGTHRRIEAGVGLFCDEEGSTTVAAAVAILVSLTLVFALANVQWSSSRAADIQTVADAGALAGCNVVAAYSTIAQVLDALVLSMGLVGLLTMAVGLVLSAIPVTQASGPPVLEAASKVFSARAKLATSCARGLEKLEGLVPYIVVANSRAVISANASSSGSYTGFALPYPIKGSSDFGSLDDDDAQQDIEGLASSGARVDELSKQAAQDEQNASDALERAWEADCGGAVCMRERAQALAGLAGSLNPSYPSSAGWDFGVAIRRGRAYYAQRLADESPASSGVEERVRSQARKAFYAYALQQLEASSYTSYADGSVSCDLKSLPRNTAELRSTTLYTSAVWPLTWEGGKLTIHGIFDCPGAKGASAGMGSVSQADSGQLATCPTCQFGASTLGRVPAASTSIDNGFEHYWKIVVEESRAYQSAKDASAGKLAEAKAEGARSCELFKDALEKLSATRVTLSPPGSVGCVCVCVDPVEHKAPSELLALFDEGARIPARAAISAAALAKDSADNGNNVLANLFDGLVAQAGVTGAASGVLDSVMSVWGNTLVAYGNGYDALSAGMSTSFQALSSWGMGGISGWLKDALSQAVELLAIKPADMSAKKPVLTNSANILAAAGGAWYEALRGALLTMSGAQSSVDLLTQITADALAYDGTGGISLGQVEMPGTGRTVELGIDLSWLAGAA